MGDKIDIKTLKLPSVIETSIPDLMLMFRGAIINEMNGHQCATNAIYEKKRGKAYNGYYYDEIVDKGSKIPLTLYIHEKFRRQLKDKQAYEFTGKLYLAKDINYSKIGVMFFVTGIGASTDETQLITESEYGIVKTRYDQGFFDIEADISDKLFRGIKPKILVLIGSSAITEDDYAAALEDADYFEIEERKTNLSNKKVFLECIASISEDYDYFVVLRGGGNGIRFFEDEGLCKEVLSAPIPFITAIGHVADNCMLQRVADKSYDTPTSFGNALQRLVEKDKSAKEDISVLEARLERKDEHYKELIGHNKELHQRDLELLAQTKNIQVKNLVYMLITLLLEV